MGMTIRTNGLDELNRILAELGANANKVAAMSLYEGAAVVADAFTRGANAIVTEPFNYVARPEMTGTMRYPSPAEKAAVVGKSGIAKFKESGSEIDTVVGITGNAGYAEVGGERKPVLLIARSINTGTSFMHKQPVFRKAVTQSKSAARAAIVAKADEKFNEIIKG